MKRVRPSKTESEDRPQATVVDWVSRVGYPCRMTKPTEAEASAFADHLRREGFSNVVQHPPEPKPQGTLGRVKRR